MTAEEKFKELGYICLKTSTSILYMNDDDNDDYEYRSIKFYLKDCTFDAVTDYNYALSIDFALFDAIQTQMKELGWFEEEQKQETNLEHYFEYLSKINMSDFALIDGRVTQCLGTGCSECDFNCDCIEGKFRWLKQPYEKPKYKLTKFEKELLECYSDVYSFEVFNSLNGMKEKGYFKDIDTKIPICEILDNCEVIK